ncbi:MAG: hypothetical protein J0I77_16030 [Rudaea sp.]|uniref:DUF5339 family protein n=1 Tax=unclassified Rudaea TaxID=2627037 RepID=UPI0010F93EBE|nr:MULTISPECIES: DUF5339 family protein [unclassified Rudaea]MBN8887232.1 hypothetical protein [Rudaea sp.]MBR0344895.1 hypothetical protein [Rudaea sp.]
MNNLNKLCSAAVLALSLAACGGKGGDSAPKPTAAPATPAAAAPAPAAPTPTTPAAPAAATATPPECDAYFERVSKCLDKAGESNPTVVATLKQQLDGSKAQWANLQDKSALASICKQSNDMFTQSAQMLKCE